MYKYNVQEGLKFILHINHPFSRTWEKWLFIFTIFLKRVGQDCLNMQAAWISCLHYDLDSIGDAPFSGKHGPGGDILLKSLV